MGVKITVKGSAENLTAAIEWLKKHKVKIGIPDGGSPRSGQDKLNNVELAYLMTNGSPINRMPPRPFLEPALEQPEEKGYIVEDMKSAAKAALEGHFNDAVNELRCAGEDGVTAVKRYMDTGNHFPPNAPITIEGGWLRNRKSGKLVYIKGKHSSKPLIDTGNLQGSIKYVIIE